MKARIINDNETNEPNKKLFRRDFAFFIKVILKFWSVWIFWMFFLRFVGRVWFGTCGREICWRLTIHNLLSSKKLSVFKKIKQSQHPKSIPPLKRGYIFPKKIYCFLNIIFFGIFILTKKYYLLKQFANVETK